MDADRFDALSRFLFASPSRRTALRLLAGSAFGLGLWQRAQPARVASAKNCKKIHDKKKRKKCQKKAKETTATPTLQDPVSPPELTYRCPGPPEQQASGGGTSRIAQLFTAVQGGSLHQVVFAITHSASPAGAYVVQLVRVIGGVPSNDPADVLAEVTVPDATVPEGNATLTASFAGPALVQDTDYAAVIQRPGASSAITVRTRAGDGNDCAGKLFVADGAGAFSGVATVDLVVSVFVV